MLGILHVGRMQVDGRNHKVAVVPVELRPPADAVRPKCADMVGMAPAGDRRVIRPEFTGQAIVFDSEEECHHVLRRGLIQPGRVLVVRWR